MKPISLLSILLILSVSITTAQIAKPASEILSAAYKEAAAENKNVLLIFHASWCGWCHKLDNSLNDATCKKYFDDNYIIIHLTVGEDDNDKAFENPGAVDVLVKYHGENAGLPFWIITDKTGQLLADSEIRPAGATLDVPGNNMGCRATKTQVAAFIKILKQTSALTDDALEIIAERFRKNNL
jgi:thiol-disulfide isomerase/thioredoxin